MSSTNTFRRVAALAATGLVAALLPAVGLVQSASAAGGCESEKQSGSLVGATVCDDSTPPTTTINGVSPTPTSDRYVNVDHVTFTFGGAASPGDSDPIAYQCQFYNTVSAPAAWDSCTSPKTYDNLDDVGPTNPVPYTFRVRAVDTADNAITSTSCTGLFCTHATTDAADLDETPDSTTVRVDTVKPDTFIFNAPVDDQGSEYPMSTSSTVHLTLDASEGTESDPLKYTCKLDGSPVACNAGDTALTGVGAGDHTFTARGHRPRRQHRPEPGRRQVLRAEEPGQGRGLDHPQEGGYFGGDVHRVAQGRRPGLRGGQERPRAPADRPRRPGPRRGRGEDRRQDWRPVNLDAKSYTRFKVYKVRGKYDPLVSGKILIRVKQLDRNQIVRVDAILAH